jgi:hypothetical protein
MSLMRCLDVSTSSLAFMTMGPGAVAIIPGGGRTTPPFMPLPPCWAEEEEVGACCPLATTLTTPNAEEADARESTTVMSCESVEVSAAAD